MSAVDITFSVDLSSEDLSSDCSPTVAGSFNNWSSTYNLTEISYGIWEATVDLNPNSYYEFKFGICDWQLENLYPDVVLINNESLVSIDFKGIRQSCVVDIRWLTVIRNKLKLILWYDNEWGYANRVIDIIKLLENS